MTTSISYAITTHNETISFEKLVNRINQYIDTDDELIILDDYSTNTHTLKTLNLCKNVHSSKFTGNYAEHKNNLNKLCTKEYIFQLDADELPTELLLHNIKEIINANKVDLLLVPRENIVHGIQQHHLTKWNWVCDEKQRINYPDYQGRIYKNSNEIKWVRPLHEYIEGHVTFGRLPGNVGLDILHIKDIEGQVANNDRYDRNYNADGTQR